MQRCFCIIAALPLTLMISCAAPMGSDRPYVEDSTQNIVGGQQTSGCGYPSVVSLGGCTGTLIHPQVVLTAAHCGSPRQATFGNQDFGGFSIGTQCFAVPDDGTRKSDTMFCLLQQTVDDIPITPIAMGCELESLIAGHPIEIVGFGLTSFANRRSGGTKRWAETELIGSQNGLAIIGTPERSACSGDSGGPAFTRLADGSLRVIGNVSGGTTGQPCSGSGAYPWSYQHVPWFEQASGIDITPCHDALGNWNPNANCKSFSTATARAAGNWQSLCNTSPRSGLGQSCGPAFSGSRRRSQNNVCRVVPSTYIGANDGCDCPATGETTCDPDCSRGVSNPAACGCDYCYP